MLADVAARWAYVPFHMQWKGHVRLLALFKETVLRTWEDRSSLMHKEVQSGRKKVEELEAEKQSLLTLMKEHYNNPDLVADFKKDYVRVKQELQTTLAERNTDEQREINAQEVVEYCVYFMANASKLWQESPVEEQYRVQSLIFPEGLSYAVLEDKQTPQLSLVYKACDDMKTPKNLVVGREGFEPPKSETSGLQPDPFGHFGTDPL